MNEHESFGAVSWLLFANLAFFILLAVVLAVKVG